MAAHDITHDPGRFHTRVEDAHCELEYRLDDRLMTITHTRVPPEVGGRGIASDLVRAAFEYARTEGLKVAPQCSYAAVWLKRHPEYADLAA